VNTLSYKSRSLKKDEYEKEWFIVDATDLVVGRMSSQIASVVRGKHKPTYTPHMDCGDHVIVINADKVRFTGKKLTDKEYLSHSGYPGGQKSVTSLELLQKHPYRIVESAVRGMLPKNRLGRQLFKNLHVYASAEHPHDAQKPKELKF